MVPFISKKSSKPIFEQVYEFYKQEILTQNLKSGTHMPSVRRLASDLDVSNNTVIRAYEQLLQEGYLSTIPRKGLYVENVQKMNLRKISSTHELQKPAAGNVKYNLSQSQIDESNFPTKAWRKMTQLALDNLHTQIHTYEDVAELKQELAKYLYTARGVRTSTDRILICAGSNMVMSVIHLLFRKTHSTVLFEEPGYTEGRSILEKFNFKITCIPVSKHGLDVASLPSGKCNLVYVTPSHQYPTGAIMPVHQRLRLLQWAIKTNSYIIEDDYDSEFRYRGNPIPSLQAIDQDDRVLYVGTFSKVLMPSLRVAYLVLPKSISWKDDALEYYSWSVGYVIQKTLALFFQQGFWDRHLRKMRKIYKKKYYHTAETIRKIFKGKVSFTVTHAGLYFVLTVKSSSSVASLITRAADKGIRLIGTEECYHKRKPKQPSFFVGFANLTEEEITDALILLHSAWRL